MKEYATVRRGFFFVFSGALFGIRWFESFWSTKNRFWIYEKPKKVIGAKNGDISRNLRFSRFFVPASKSDTHHVWIGQFRTEYLL